MENLLNILSNAASFLVNDQQNNQYWDDNSDTNVYLGYYTGVAGISDQMLSIPDLSGPSLSMIMFSVQPSFWKVSLPCHAFWRTLHFYS